MKSYLYDALWSIIALACLIGAVLVILGTVGCSTSGGTMDDNNNIFCVICMSPTGAAVEKIKDDREDDEVDDVPQPEPVG